MTRPFRDSEAFVASLRRRAGPFRPVLSPAFDFAAVDGDLPVFDDAIFTSRTGVRFAPDGAGRRAYCVGDATSAAAREAGYMAVSAEGDVNDLIHLILQARPTGRLAHMRGEASVGEVAATLTSNGLRCADAVTYRKTRVPPTDAALTMLRSDEPFILPLFSAETVTILSEWGDQIGAGHIVAISAAVARQSADLTPASIRVADRPNQPAMVATVAGLIA